MNKALVIAATLLVAACGSQAGAVSSPNSAPSSAATVQPAVTPSPLVTPLEARINLGLAWETKTSSLGDVSENLVVTISSNVPMTFLIYPGGVVFRGQNIDSSVVAFGFEMHPYESHEWRLRFESRAPAGKYTVSFDVPSYTYLGTQQTAQYTSWVGGDQGMLLKGNPQAVHDSAHPAVLNLRATSAVTHG